MSGPTKDQQILLSLLSYLIIQQGGEVKVPETYLEELYGKQMVIRNDPETGSLILNVMEKPTCLN